MSTGALYLNFIFVAMKNKQDKKELIDSRAKDFIDRYYFEKEELLQIYEFKSKNKE